MILCSMRKPTAGKKNHCENWRISANKNHDLIVISISFLAFNFHGIIRRTSSKYFPLLFPFLIYAKIRSADRILVERKVKRGGKEKRISNSTDNENYFILSRWKIGREFHRWLPSLFPPSPYLYFVALSLFSIIFHLSITQTFHFCKIMDFSIKENIRMFGNK